MRCTRLIRLLNVAACLMGLQSVVFANGLGLDLIDNTAERYAHPDIAGSVDSSVLRRRIYGFWHEEWDEGRNLNVSIEQEQYALRDPTERPLIDLTLNKLHPRFRMRRDTWAVDASVLLIDVTRNDAVFTPAPEDEADLLVLPALVGEVRRLPMLFRLGVWEEYEILPLDLERYAITVSRVYQAGAGYAFNQRLESWLEAFQTQRYRPEGFPLDRTNVVASLRLRDPLDEGDTAVWRDVSAEVARKHYPASGDSYTELNLQTVFRLRAGEVTHFLTPTLSGSDSYVTFGPGSSSGTFPDTLLEQTQAGTDWLLGLQYEGFTRLGGSPWFLAWGGQFESSLHQGVERTVIVHVKAEYTY